MRPNESIPRGDVRQENGWTLLEALAAIVVVGIGIALFLRVQHGSSRDSADNSRMLMAGKMIEKFLEDTRITIAKDTLANWPPPNRVVTGTAPSFITITSTISTAYSPKDLAPVANVMRMDIAARWVQPYPDSLLVTTYVSKRF